MENEFKKIVKTSYDSQADLYESRSAMQSKNLIKLVDYMIKEVGKLDLGNYLDVGCGNGILISELQNRLKKNFDSIKYFGIDISDSMIRNAKKRYPNICCFSVSDADNLDFEDNFFDIVISNSVLHWLNIPEKGETPQKALAEIHRVIKHKGIVALSISAEGTANNFQTSFGKVIQSLSKTKINNEATFRKDPIGSLPLHTLVDYLQDTGFEIIMARTDYEPVYYESPVEYTVDVKAYGYEVYLASVLKEYWSEVWENVVLQFTKDNGHERYIHDQYMNYIICFKK